MTMMSIPKESTTLGCYKSFLPKNYTMNKEANHLFLIGDVGGFFTSRWIIPTSNDGGKPFSDGGNRPPRSDGCHNPSLGLVTKVRACKDVGQKWSLGVTFHAPENVGECEGMNLHTPKWTPTLGIGILIDFWIFIERFYGSKPIGLKSFLYHWKALGRTYMSKMGSHDPFEYLKHKLWPKEGSGVVALTSGSQPKQRFIRVRAKRSVRECEHEDPHSQMSSHFGSWSLGGLPNLHKAIVKVKTPRIEEFFISSKKY